MASYDLKVYCIILMLITEISEKVHIFAPLIDE